MDLNVFTLAVVVYWSDVWTCASFHSGVYHYASDMINSFSTVVPTLRLCSSFQEVMSVEEESTSCYCLMDSSSCHLLLDQPGSYALVGEPLTQAAVKRLKLAVFGSKEAGSMNYSLRVYCVDDTPHAFQVGMIVFFSCFVFWLLMEP